MKIVFAGGGTGGHLFPALAVADEFKRRRPEAAIRFIGGRRGLENRLVPRAGYPLRTLRISGMKGRGPLAQGIAAVAAAWAVVRCLAWMLAARPDLVIGVGGYASGPAVLAARLLRVKTMILEQNHFPGATNRVLAPRVDVVCVPSEAARRRLGNVGLVTGNPVRPEFREIGKVQTGHSDGLALLVFGGSRGARSINRAMSDAISELARLTPAPRIVHQTGADDETTVRQAYENYPADRFQVQAFLDDMPERLAAAELVVCRAGATTLSELAVAGRPAILVPYPHAADDHQRHNAEEVEREGAAIVIVDRELTGARLAAAVTELADDSPRRQRMAGAARRLATPDATRRIVDAAETLLGGAHVS